MNAFWRLHHNKILAIGFASLGILAFAAQLALLGVYVGWNVYFASPWAYINIVITAVVYLMLLITNIQNDDRAYLAIELITLFLIYDAVWSLLPFGDNFGGYLGLAFPYWLWGLFLVLTNGGIIGMGIAFYVHLIRYRMGSGTYERLRLWAYLLLLGVVANAALTFAFYLFTGLGNIAGNVAIALLLLLPDVLMFIACRFTLARLRRY